MPTAEQFRSEARALTDHLATLTAMHGRIDDARGAPGLSGGSDALLVDRSLVGAALNVGRLGQLAGAVIDELGRRAQLCDVYTQDLADWEARYGRWAQRHRDFLVAINAGEPAIGPGPAPIRPRPPFEGAEAG